MTQRRRRVRCAYREACALELAALKPGNVHQEAGGHGMTVDDFLLSADASAWPLTDPDIGLGERLYRSVSATRSAVGRNTNLGILLLCGPLAQAVVDPRLSGSLRQRLKQVLERCDRRDTQGLFEAIRLAAPAGLGSAETHDVAGPVSATPLEAMAQAAQRDQIAYQYVGGFADLFERGQRLLDALEHRWSDPVWATAGLFMDFLARVPDSHIARKLGPEVARSVLERAAPLTKALLGASRPEGCRAELQRFDRALKAEGINPGTSADLTVASLFIRRLEPVCAELEATAGACRYSPSLAGGHAPRAIL
ncbi:triphosphoribosyl-dephospho-CoA synthase [Thiorhodococcus minor]|uniref:Triphosphoribosyl-dephospho-CoA synthase n=2 Tax=Thiorhodococcus minor TaxID=57489 RepID=A0A6M0K2V7_9GAMM|nr:triphosphoribosyl-dephospho-CoA synthase [Thiorhodococcus minor]